MSTASLQEHLEMQQRALPAPAPSQTWRRDALASFVARGFPSRREERWHYTDLGRLEDERFPLVSRVPSAETRLAARALLEAQGIDLAGQRLVFVDGHLDATLSRFDTGPSLAVSTPNDAWDSFASERTAATSTTRTYPLAMLNTAFLQQGALVKVGRRNDPQIPLQIVFLAVSGDRAAPQPRIIVELAEGAEATVVQHFLDAPGAAPGWLNLVTEVVQAPESRLTLYRLQEHGAAHLHTSLLNARLGCDALLTAGYIERGGRLVRNDVDVLLAEAGARADLFGLTLGNGEQHIDNYACVEHAAARTASTTAFRAIADGSARCVFCAKVIVQPGAQKVDARQASDGLLLSPRAEIDSKPELEIYANDIKCAHGATVGELDEEQLFYLRSRGMNPDAARAMLTLAFAQVAVERIALAPVRARAIADFAARLPEARDSGETGW
jgi:Fe-S cluster assembly protein SufD